MNTQDRNALILEFKPLVVATAKRIAQKMPKSVELDDLISVGILGLIDALEKYDPSHNVQFKTYAEFRIKGAILDELRDLDFVPRSAREKTKLYDRAFIKLTQVLARTPEPAEIRRALNLSEKDYFEWCMEIHPQLFLDTTDRKHLELVCPNSDPEKEATWNERLSFLAQAIGTLPPRQQDILQRYYWEGQTLQVIGKALTLSESRVSQVMTHALILLKRRLNWMNFEEA